MVRFSQEFKVQSVEKALSRSKDQTLKYLSGSLGVGQSTLEKWIRLAKENKLEIPKPPMSKEKSPQDWSKSQRLDAIIHCHSMTDQQVSTYCRENGVYPHHLKAWKKAFLSDTQGAGAKQEQKKLKKENKQLQKELNRKEKALAETAALLVLSKKCQAIWGEREVE
jgi:transposase-like protein